MILQANGFDWDRGNRTKCEEHGLSVADIESLFERPLAILPDAGPLEAGESLSRYRPDGERTWRIHYFHASAEGQGRRPYDPAHQRPPHAQKGD